MITTICLIILVFAILHKPAGRLLDSLKGVDWKKFSDSAWLRIKQFAYKAGRGATRILLIFYYTLTGEQLTTLEKALLYAGIIYIAVPHDLLPRRIFGLLGLVDDAAVGAWVYDRIRKNISPAVLQKAEDTLNEWFGAEKVRGTDVRRVD
ncbi:MAG: DUF1232 domain-containing protein [Bacteroidales bacterium]|nr:DUF1232 domain-containing protein [Bacteroidales bacterium]